jgi:hypothetical protein
VVDLAVIAKVQVLPLLPAKVQLASDSLLAHLPRALPTPSLAWAISARLAPANSVVKIDSPCQHLPIVLPLSVALLECNIRRVRLLSRALPAKEVLVLLFVTELAVSEARREGKTTRQAAEVETNKAMDLGLAISKTNSKPTLSLLRLSKPRKTVGTGELCKSMPIRLKWWTVRSRVSSTS